MVRDPAVHQQCIDKVVSGMVLMGFDCGGTIPSPIKGAKEGNTEFLSLFRLERPGPLPESTLAQLFGRRGEGGAGGAGGEGGDDSGDEEGGSGGATLTTAEGGAAGGGCDAGASSPAPAPTRGGGGRVGQGGGRKTKR